MNRNGSAVSGFVFAEASLAVAVELILGSPGGIGTF
jgi:hypothetical protein